MSEQETVRGQIIRAQSGFFTIQTDDGQLVTRLRGRLKKGRRQGDIAAVGDWVIASRLPDGKGMIEEIEPRQHMIVRMAPTPRGEYQQIIIANPDQVVLVFACTDPPPHLRMLDRFLVIAERQDVPVVIVANKVDLVSLDEARQIFDHYAEIGYRLIYTSVNQNLGLEELRQHLAGKLSVMAGPSGVGKSSLLNALQPGLGLLVREVSKATSKGRHTTVVRELFPLDDGGYVADTPGLKALALWDIQPEEIDAYFPELRDLVPECQFSNCTHIHEPGCAVIDAVEAGEVHPERYESYVRMRMGDDED